VPVEKALSRLVETRSYKYCLERLEVWKWILEAIRDDKWFDEVTAAGRENARGLLQAIENGRDPPITSFGRNNTAAETAFDKWLREALRQRQFPARPDAASPGDVLFLALEDSKRRLQRRLTKHHGALPENWSRRLHIKNEWRRFDQGGLDDIREWCKSVSNPRLIVVDTLAKVRAPGSPKVTPYQNDHDALAGLQRLAQELGIAIIVAHHDRKSGADDIFDTVSGTLGLTGAVDTILVLTRKAQDATLHVRGRDIENEESLAMRFDKGTCKWTVLGAAAEVHRSDERARVLALLQNTPLQNTPDGFRVGAIIDGAQLRNRNAAYILLSKMTEDGEIERRSRGIYGLPREEKDRTERKI
jgi:hypothetical protein